jgi:hypothetical protein
MPEGLVVPIRILALAGITLRSSILEKKLEKGSAPSRAKAQILRTATIWKPTWPVMEAMKIIRPHPKAAFVLLND